MGSEQSSQSEQGVKQISQHTTNQLRRGKSAPEADGVDVTRPGSISPGPSVCSDSDLPYISYTVNRPIGDSPKLTAKPGHLARGKSFAASSLLTSSPTKKVLLRKQAPPRSAGLHNIVVVQPALAHETSDKDADLLKLQSVPMFLPIMRGTLNLPTVRDPEVLERLDPSALHRLCLRCEQHLSQSATLVADQQGLLALMIRDVDCETNRLIAIMTERQKSFAKYAEKLNKVGELSQQINMCHLALNQSLDMVEKLNNALPMDQRLEPFIWTTG